MDFLDPRKKSARRKRLAASYLVMGLLVVVSAAVLLAITFGYGINTKTGKLVQNGLVFMDSAPTKAEIYINGVDTGKSTPAHAIYPGAVRLVLASGQYKIELRESGYRIWSDTVHLPAQGLLRFDYPLLLPAKLSASSLASFQSPPLFSSQSLDGKWILIGNSSPSGSVSISQFSSVNPATSAVNLAIPASILKVKSNSWLASEWSNDGSALLLRHGSSSPEYIELSRTNPAKTFNLSSLSKVSISKAEMRAGNPTRFYILAGGKLEYFDSVSGSTTLIATNVIDFTSSRSDKLLYVTTSGAPAGQALAQVWQSGQPYTLAKIKSSGGYLLAASSLQGDDYYLVGSKSQSAVIYKNPIGSLSSASSSTLKPQVSMKLNNATYTSVSPSSRFMLISSANNFAIYDIERDSTYRYSANLVAAPAYWLDDFHLGSLSNSGQAMIWDFDGSNQQTILPSKLGQGSFLDPSGRHLYTLADSRGIYKLQVSKLTL